MVDATHIQLRDVSRTYVSAGGPSVQALRNVNLTIGRGEFVAVVGPSGGGKSTLLNILGLLDAPSEGAYELNGVDADVRRDAMAASIRNARIGFVFQSFHLLNARPSIDSVELGLLYMGVNARKRTEIAKGALATVGLSSLAEKSTTKLSGGQRQRVAIARAIAGGADLLLADEPTGNLDSENAKLVLDELDRLNARGVTVIVVTHSAEVAARASRVIRVVDGTIVADDPQPVPVGLPLAGDAPPFSTRTPAAFRAKTEGREHEAPRGRVRRLDLLRDAWSSILSRPSQTVGLCIAVAIAVAMSVTTLGLTASATAQVSSTFDAHLNREVSARWSTGVQHAPAVSRSPDIALSLSGVDAAAVLVDLSPANVSSLGTTGQVRPHIGVGNIVTAGRLTVTMAPWHTGELRSDELLIGDLLATKLQLGSLQNAPFVEIDGRSFSVVGIITESSRLPLLRGEVVRGAPDDLSSIGSFDATLLVVTAAGAAPQIAAQLPAALNPYSPDSIFVSAPTDSATIRGQVESGVQAALTAFTALALVVATAALTNATLLAVYTRRGEIGMRKAIGARNSQIAGLITIESAYVGLLGGVLGLFAGMIALLIITISQNWAPVFDVALLPTALVTGLLVGTLGGVVAAVRASRARPADALRS